MQIEWQRSQCSASVFEQRYVNNFDRLYFVHIPGKNIFIEKPQKIDVFEDYLYIKLYDQSIIKMNKFGVDNGTYLLKGYRSSDIGILHPLKQNRNSEYYLK